MQIYRITEGVREEVGYKDTPHLRRMAMQEGCYYLYEYNNSRRFGETGACSAGLMAWRDRSVIEMPLHIKLVSEII